MDTNSAAEITKNAHETMQVRLLNNISAKVDDHETHENDQVIKRKFSAASVVIAY